MWRQALRSSHSRVIKEKSSHCTSTPMAISLWRAHLIKLPKSGMSAPASVCSPFKVTQKRYQSVNSTLLVTTASLEVSTGQHACGTQALDSASKNSVVTMTKCSMLASTRLVTNLRRHLLTEWHVSTMCLQVHALQSFKATQVRSVKSPLILKETKWSRHRVIRRAGSGLLRQVMSFSVWDLCLARVTKMKSSHVHSTMRATPSLRALKIILAASGRTKDSFASLRRRRDMAKRSKIDSL